MKLLENRILRDAQILDDGYLKVDGFIGEKTDVAFVRELAVELSRRFSDSGATKVLAAATSSIAAGLVALKLDIPVILASKTGVRNSEEVYTGKVVSFTNSEVYDLSVSRNNVSRNDKILIISDFLSKGNEILGLLDIVEQAGAAICGAGVLIEKSYLNGAGCLRDKGVRVESLAKIESMSRANGVRFCRE